MISRLYSCIYNNISFLRSEEFQKFSRYLKDILYRTLNMKESGRGRDIAMHIGCCIVRENDSRARNTKDFAYKLEMLTICRFT